MCELILEKLVVLEDNTLSCADRDIEEEDGCYWGYKGLEEG